MRNTMTTKRDLRNWVDSATSNWDDRTGDDVDAITNWIQKDQSRPNWGQDWSDYLSSLDLYHIITGLGR